MIPKISTNQQIYTNSTEIKKETTSVENTVAQTMPNKTINNISFKGLPFFQPLPGITDKEDKQKYSELAAFLDSRDEKKLEILLKTGRLLSKDSNDTSSALDNLYKIMKEPRIQGLSNKNILSETLSALTNPFIITQDFGELPREFIEKKVNENLANKSGLEPNAAKTTQDLEVDASGTCVAASIEFNLADKKPAEFARYVAGLTNQDMSVKVKLQDNDISSNMVNTIDFLNQFKIDYKVLDWENLEVNLKPDRDAIIRARVQESSANPNDRSSIDVLLQSTFMQIGSQRTYNSL
ncbi:MAG: hypothetical protein PHV68_06550, partial [Candidatus Gastranaerophilales bacterium]|nr:hypothetical protein [Candidatus Gastranaerophilales bacterium]